MVVSADAPSLPETKIIGRIDIVIIDLRVIIIIRS